MKEIKICIAGLGNVGSSVVQSLIDSKNFINFKSSFNIDIIGISAKNKNKKRIIDISKYNWFDNPLDFLNTDCDIVIELIGEEKGLSYDLVKSSLKKGKHVITANKALLAKNGSELFKIADENNTYLLYEAAVAGGIPIIKTLKNNIALNKIKKISGILNGTTNYILTMMEQDNLSFDEAILIAQSKGYTSPSESELDIGGLDSAHKLTILSSLCFGAEVDFDNNYITGISEIKYEDIKNAKNLGYKIKLISESLIVNNKIFSITSPKLISINKPLASVDGVLNAINIETDQLESLFLEGEGAGGKATASSVISDINEIFTNTNVNSLGFKIDNLTKYTKFELSNLESPYYLRIMTQDITGVLSKITSYFKESNISVEKILQLPESKDKPIPIIITTHKVKRSTLLKSLEQIEKQSFVLDKIIVIPLDNGQE